MLEIIKETLLELKKIKTENNESKESLNNSVRKLEFIIKTCLSLNKTIKACHWL